MGASTFGTIVAVGSETGGWAGATWFPSTGLVGTAGVGVGDAIDGDVSATGTAAAGTLEDVSGTNWSAGADGAEGVDPNWATPGCEATVPSTDAEVLAACCCAKRSLARAAMRSAKSGLSRASAGSSGTTGSLGTVQRPYKLSAAKRSH